MSDRDGAGAGELTSAPWLVVIPLRPLHLAKSRLAPHVGGLRVDLVLAMAVDTVAAAARAPDTDVLVVTDDPRAAVVLADAGARVVPDVPGTGVNDALRHGASLVDGHRGVLSLMADLPALRPEELSEFLDSLARHGRGFGADAAGTGTTALGSVRDESFEPAFGPGSAARHARHAPLLGAGLATLRRDVDTVEDLRAAQRLGLGPATAEVVGQVGVRSA